ncbi:MAG: DUF169 domain-containing protein [Dehalococcoidales bacterium]|nr:DUF169 domain-containing protein [Dehalococcoidales bacterium]
MKPMIRDYSIFNKFNFEKKPVGIKFLLNKPEGLEQTDKIMPICRLFKEAQSIQPFYATKENFSCVDRLVLGMTDPEPIMTSGQIGAKEKIYREARANRRVYQNITKIPRNTVRYVVFSPYDKLTFDPDLLVITAKPSDAEIIFRALSYSLGKPLASKFTPVLMCSWMFAYPFITGEINYTVSGIGHGMRLQKVLPEGLLVISIPFDVIPMLMNNLKEMDWILPMIDLSEEEWEEYAKNIMSELQQEYQIV